MTPPQNHAIAMRSAIHPLPWGCLMTPYHHKRHIGGLGVTQNGARCARAAGRMIMKPHSMSVIGCGLSVVGYRLSVIGDRLSVIGDRLSVMGYRLWGIGCGVSVVGYWVTRTVGCCSGARGRQGQNKAREIITKLDQDKCEGTTDVIYRVLELKDVRPPICYPQMPFQLAVRFLLKVPSPGHI